jgi:chromosome segregation ATPase
LAVIGGITGGLVVLGAIGTLGFAWTNTRSTLARERADTAELRASLDTLRQELAVAQEAIAEQTDEIEGLTSELAAAGTQIDSLKKKNAQLRKDNADLLAGILGGEALLANKVACLDEVLDAYNQYYYYWEIGQALERALNSQTCIQAGIV